MYTFQTNSNYGFYHVVKMSRLTNNLKNIVQVSVVFFVILDVAKKKCCFSFVCAIRIIDSQHDGNPSDLEID